MTLDPDQIALRREEQKNPREEIKLDPKILDKYIGYYQLRPSAIFTVTRQGDNLFVQLTGQDALQAYPESAQKFFFKIVPAQISFIGNPQDRATELVLHQHGGELCAPRVDQAEAQKAEDAFATRIREGAPAPGSEAALRRHIEAMLQGQPDYSEMTEELASVARPQIPDIQRQFAKLGSLRSISFRGVGLQGWDVYEVKFENGVATWRLCLEPDGKISGLLCQAGP